MTTPRFLILPDLIVNVDEIVAIGAGILEDGPATRIKFRTDGDALTRTPFAEVTAALREAMKGDADLREVLAAAEAELVAWANWDSYGTPAKGESLDALNKATDANEATRARLGFPPIS